MNNPARTDQFLVTKEHRRFVEFCEACRRYRYIGLCYGASGVGKTLSSRVYAHWDQVAYLHSLHYNDLPAAPEILAYRTVLYTAPVNATSQRVEREVRELQSRFNYLLADMAFILSDAKSARPFATVPNQMELLIVDEADRLKTAGLEQMRDLYDRGQVGLVFIGMPGLEKRLARYPQLYSRVGFVHHFKPLSTEEMHFVLEHKWQQLDLTIDLSDFTDAEAVAAIIRITGGNFRLLQRLFGQIERVMQINDLRYVTTEVVEAARELLVIGPA